MKTSSSTPNNEQYKIRLSSKKLQSGRCQVKFYARLSDHKQLYGYLLVDARDTLKQVVGKIRERLDRRRNGDSFYHMDLYRIGKRNTDDTNFIIFDA